MALPRIRFGLLLPTRKVVFSSGEDRRALHEATQSEILELAREAERLGFDLLGVGDSILAKPRLEALMTLSAVAAHTRRLQLMTTILIPVLRDPLLLAYQVSTLDYLCSGRLILGLGVGEPTDIVRKEFRDLGISFKTRGRRSDELLRLLKRLWTEDHVTHQGDYYRYSDVSVQPKPLQLPHPALFVGAGHYNFDSGQVEGPFARVAELGDGWISTLITPAERRAAWAQIAERAAAAGRDPGSIIQATYLSINIRESRQQAMEEQRSFLAGYLGESWEQFFEGGAQIERWGAFGTAEDCRQIVAAFLDSGSRIIILRLPRDDQLQQAREVAEHILPYFQ